MNELSVDLTFNARHRRGADPRLDALLETLDRLLPAADRLLFAIPDAGQPFKVKDRAGWLRERAAADKPAILCNGDKAHEEFVSLEVLHLSARYGPGHEPALVVSLEMALSRAPYVLDLVAPIGDAIDAHRGAVSRSQADPEAESVTGQTQRPRDTRRDRVDQLLVSADVQAHRVSGRDAGSGSAAVSTDDRDW
jgi:hypothetical protein